FPVSPRDYRGLTASAFSLPWRSADDKVAKPLNVNRVSVDDLLACSALILGTPTYGEGVLPGLESKNREPSWLEFLPGIEGSDFTGKRVALFGLGDQEQYPAHFLSAMMDLHECFAAAGAELVGGSPTEGFEFTHSRAVVDGRFIGLALDQHLQHLLTDARIDVWLDEITPLLDPA
ncbi:MAG: flavodoxin domain-containing protein, partial [Candidatus Thiodiazotropha sp.]